MDTIKESLKYVKLYLKVLLKWLLLATVIGTVCGGVGSLLYFCVELALEERATHSWLLYLLPLAGLLIVESYHLLHMDEDGGTDLVLLSIRSRQKVPLSMAYLIFISTCLTQLCGGSAGREGAALQIGGSLGHLIGKIFHMSEKDQTIITMCGMSAVFTALFGTPLTATLFSMEVVSVGVFYYAALIPCLVASLISQALAWALGFTPLFYTVKIPAMEFLSFGRVAVLACLGALVSIVFCVLLRHGGRFFAKVIPNPWLRIFFGGIAIVLLTLALGTYDYNGLGLPVIGRALAGEAVPTAFLWKILFTVITIGVGFKGGEIVPTLFIGAVFGCCVGQWLGLPADFGAAIGLTSLFCAVVNCPISSIILSVELFGGSGLLFFALASAVSFMLSGKYSLYHEQKIVYSKIAAKFIDASTH